MTFRIESAEATFEVLAPLAVGRSREDLLTMQGSFLPVFSCASRGIKV
jgi:hypothetical protein